MKIKCLLQHLLVYGQRCRLSEVNDPRLVLTDVMHQHNSTTKHQQSTKDSKVSYLTRSKNLSVRPVEKRLICFYHSPSNTRSVRVDNPQTEGSSDGSVNTGPLFPQNVKAKRCTLRHICHHCPLVKDLARNRRTKQEGGDCQYAFELSWVCVEGN